MINRIRSNLTLIAGYKASNDVSQRAGKKALIFAGVLLLCSCDGGIFGTGGPDPMGLDAGFSTDHGLNSQPDTAGNTDGGETTNGTTDGSTTAGSTTDGNTTDGGFIDSPEAQSIENTTATLSTTDVLIRIVNTSDTTINVYNLVDVRKELIYGDNGIAPNGISAANPTSQGEYEREVVDNDDLANILLSLSPFSIGESTFTTLVFRSDNSTNSILALPTELSTTDAALAKLRVVQVDSFGNPDATATFNVLSGGEDPGGIDIAFDGVSYNAPQTIYMELPAGDYLLSDSLSRFSDQALSVAGGVVYTVLITDNATDPLLIVNDSDNTAQ